MLVFFLGKETFMSRDCNALRRELSKYFMTVSSLHLCFVMYPFIKFFSTPVTFLGMNHIRPSCANDIHRRQKYINDSFRSFFTFTTPTRAVNDSAVSKG